MTLIYGHRGARGEAPENTLVAFQSCLAHGVRRCELDLHLSRDGQLVVIHDPTLRRTTGHAGKVAEHTAADLHSLDARRNGPGYTEPAPIPTLQELFEQCPFEHWQLEIKSASRTRAARSVQAVEALARQYGQLDKITVTSSSREVLRALQRLTPKLSRGLIAEYDRLDPIKVAKANGCGLLVLYWALCTPERVARAHRQGLQVSVWTVNNPELMKRLAAMEVDSIITDYPGLAVRTLAS